MNEMKWQHNPATCTIQKQLYFVAFIEVILPLTQHTHGRLQRGCSLSCARRELLTAEEHTNTQTAAATTKGRNKSRQWRN